MTDAPGTRARELALLLFLAVLWGGSFTLIKIAVGSYPPATLVAIRIAIGGGLLAMIARARGHAFPSDGRTWRRLLVQGALQSAVPFTLISWGETHVDSGLAGVVNATPPMFVFVISAFVLGTTPFALSRFAGVVLGLVGVAVIAGIGSANITAANVLAVLAVLGASLCYALGAIHGHRFDKLPTVVTASGSLIMGSLFMVPISCVVDRPWTLSPAPRATLAVLALAVFSTAVGSLVFFRLLKTLGSLATTSNAYLRALVSVLLGVIFLGEPLTVNIVAGGLLVVVGVPLVTGQLRLPLAATRLGAAPAERAAESRR
jgi:drug/metabolite transporter (DMT)-like permease